MDTPEIRQACVDKLIGGKKWLTTAEVTMLVGAGTANALDALSKLTDNCIDRQMKPGEKAKWKHNGKDYKPTTYNRKVANTTFNKKQESAITAIDDMLEDVKQKRDFAADVIIQLQGIVNDMKANLF